MASSLFLYRMDATMAASMPCSQPYFQQGESKSASKTTVHMELEEQQVFTYNSSLTDTQHSTSKSGGQYSSAAKATDVRAIAAAAVVASSSVMCSPKHVCAMGVCTGCALSIERMTCRHPASAAPPPTHWLCDSEVHVQYVSPSFRGSINISAEQLECEHLG